MSNQIVERVIDFIRQYPPFNFLSKEELAITARQVEIKYIRAKEVIFKQGDLPGKRIFLVRKGAVLLVRTESEERVLIDECDEGDVFGIRPILAQEPYSLTAIADEDTILYSIDTEGYNKLLLANPEISYYLARNFAAGVRNVESRKNRGRIFMQSEHPLETKHRLVEVQSMESSKTPVVCSPETTIQNAALIMSDNEVGSIIIVSPDRHPIGIITDKDLRKKVVAEYVSRQNPVSVIMTSPVITVGPDITVATVQILMIKNRIHHLCVTEDGTIHSPVIGVLSEHDLLVIQGNNPAILIRELTRAKNAADLRNLRERAEQLLRKYLFQEVSIAFISTVMSELNDELIKRAIEMALDTMALNGRGQPPTTFCWLALGSEGRQEQLLRTDQDNALVFEDVPSVDLPEVKAWFLAFSELVTDTLNEVGFDYCPGNMMARNPDWCIPLGSWKKQFTNWINNPSSEALLYSNIFFDFRPVYGNSELATTLTQHIFEEIDRQNIFLGFMAKNALQNPPPLSFFRNFVVERGGAHNNEFDIKKRAMMPLADAARVLILEAKIPSINNTFRRFERLAELEPQNEEIFVAAADSYEIMMRYRALFGLKNLTSGRFITPSELNKLQRLNLRNAFQPINELQSLLTMRFQLNYIR